MRVEGCSHKRLKEAGIELLVGNDKGLLEKDIEVAISNTEALLNSLYQRYIKDLIRLE